MAGYLYNADNVVVGVAQLSYCPYDPQNVTPAPDDSMYQLFTDFGTPWVTAGATSEGFKATVNTDTQDITIEEQALPVSTTLTSKSIVVSGALSEDTLENMQLAWGGGKITSTTAGASKPGKDVMTLSAELEFKTIVLDMKNEHGLARRVYVPKALPAASGDTEFRRAASQRLYPLDFTAACKASEIQIINYTAPPTA